MAEVKWIKINVDIFDNDKFDAIETLPDGLMIELVWLKLLCLAGKCNCGGMLVIADEIPYTDEMLAKRFHMEIGVIQRSIEQFERLGMIDVVDNVYLVSNWNRYQNVDRLDKIREKDRERKREKRALAENSMEIPRTFHGNSTDKSDGNALISISSNSISFEEDRGMGEEETLDDQRKQDINNIVDYLNSVCRTNFKATTGETKKHINARLNEGYSVEDFKAVIDVKAKEWLGTSMGKYLRPATLFAPSKFEGYLNESLISNNDNDPMKGIV